MSYFLKPAMLGALALGLILGSVPVAQAANDGDTPPARVKQHKPQHRANQNGANGGQYGNRSAGGPSNPGKHLGRSGDMPDNNGRHMGRSDDMPGNNGKHMGRPDGRSGNNGDQMGRPGQRPPRDGQQRGPNGQSNRPADRNQDDDGVRN